MIAALVVSWLAVTSRCDGSDLLTPVVRYEVSLFYAPVTGHHVEGGLTVADYTRTRLLSVPGTSVDLDPGPGGVVGWDGMWDQGWTSPAPPAVVAVTQAGNASDACH